MNVGGAARPEEKQNIPFKMQVIPEMQIFVTANQFLLV